MDLSLGLHWFTLVYIGLHWFDKPKGTKEDYLMPFGLPKFPLSDYCDKGNPWFTLVYIG